METFGVGLYVHQSDSLYQRFNHVNIMKLMIQESLLYVDPSFFSIYEDNGRSDG
jgi:hypothetical protein